MPRIAQNRSSGVIWQAIGPLRWWAALRAVMAGLLRDHHEVTANSSDFKFPVGWAHHLRLVSTPLRDLVQAQSLSKSVGLRSKCILEPGGQKHVKTRANLKNTCFVRVLEPPRAPLGVILEKDHVLSGESAKSHALSAPRPDLMRNSLVQVGLLT